MESSFAMTTLIFLGAAIVMVPLVRKMGLSSVIGYILGGIIIGPFVLKLTGSDTDNIMHATEFGVVMLLFLVGLELEPKKFWGMRKKIIGLGLSQVVITTIILYAIFTWADWRPDQAITIALCFSLSSTAIVLQTLQEKNIFNTVAGEASFSTLLMQDIAVIPILALLPLIANYKPSEETPATLFLQRFPEWVQSFSVIFGVLILIILGKYVFVPFLRYVSKSGMSELLTASSLFLIIGVSELMILVGLSPALGAFIAGVMLANSEFRHELESHIDPFKGLLLAVFFVSVGSTINFNVILQDPIFIFGTAAVVLLVKFGVLFGIGKFFKMFNDQNFLYAFALSQVGEFAFVLLNYSANLYLVEPVFQSQMLAVVAITMMATPFLLILNERVIAPNFNIKLSVDDEEESINQDIDQRKIIIVGFGHFGSTVGRLLRVNKIKPTVLDHDSNRVRILRSYGFKVYYGDAKRLQMMKTAGAENAEILVLCLDKPEDNLYIAQMARENFPQLKIFVRSKNRNDAFTLINSGIDNIYRETLGTAVNMAVDVLQETGMRKYAARRMAKRFTLIDKEVTRKLAKSKISDDFTFTTKDALERESALLALDNLNFDDTKFQEKEEEQEQI